LRLPLSGHAQTNPELGDTDGRRKTLHTELEMEMQGLTAEIITQLVVAAVAMVVGWLASSFKMTSRSEFTREIREISNRLSEIEGEQKSFVTRNEFRDAIRDLRADLDRQHAQLYEQLNAINAALLNRRRTDDK